MTHQNVISAMLGYTNVTTFYENDVYMAFLPLAHVLELIAGNSALASILSCLANIFVTDREHLDVVRHSSRVFHAAHHD